MVNDLQFFGNFAILYSPAYYSDSINAFPPACLKDGIGYQQMMLCFAILPALRAAFAAFFIDQGKGKMIIVTVSVGFILNIILNYILIYEMEGILPATGDGDCLCKHLSNFRLRRRIFQYKP
jgi:Na+-driven multidrug efflux pump